MKNIRSNIVSIMRTDNEVMRISMEEERRKRQKDCYQKRNKGKFKIQLMRKHGRLYVRRNI